MSDFGKTAPRGPVSPLSSMVWSAIAWAFGFQLVTVVPAVILMIAVPGMPMVLTMGLSMLGAGAMLYGFLRAKGVDRTVLMRGESDMRATLMTIGFAIGGVVFAALLATGLASVFGEAGLATDKAFADMMAKSALPLVMFSVVIAAPLVEEVLYRGFFMGVLLARGWEAWAAIVLTSAIFAVQHIQYNWIGMVVVFIYGIVFGIVRIASGGLAMPILAHGVVNAAAVVMSQVFTQAPT